VPLVALVPSWLLAMAAFWFPISRFVDLGAGILLFLRPVQKVMLTRMLGARPATPAETAVLAPVWNAVTQSARSSPRRYVLAVLDADDVNAYACGGHLVVVTSYALRVLPDRELAGVLAHELSHHLGLHTVALTVRHWLSLPVLLLARIGFFLQNVAQAATEAFARRSTGLTVIGTIVSLILRGIAWLFLLTILISNALANVVGRTAEFEADRRAADMGFGPQLAAALRRFVSSGLARRETSWRDRALASHPSARLRIARIDAYVRSSRSRLA
jgi:Zn-dependent protease with chaperone function